MVDEPIWIWGALANHRRANVLRSAISAQSTSERPRTGICLMFGDDFQHEDAEVQRKEWLDWVQEPGRTLLLIPPFLNGVNLTPIEWEAMRRAAGKSISSNALMRVLATEVRHELRGQYLQIAPDGTWEDISICTAFWRKHPAAGIIAITCLPLWSLAVLDREEELAHWLANLHALAGKQQETVVLEEPSAFQLNQAHWALLLHLLHGRYISVPEALAQLKNSAIFAVEPVKAATALEELTEHGLANGSQLTEAGRQALRESQYEPYANELEEVGI